MAVRNCDVCGSEFDARGRAKRCSDDCRRESARSRVADRRAAAGHVTYECPGCGGTISRAAWLPPSASGMCVRCQATSRRGEDHPRWGGGEIFHKGAGRWYTNRDGRRVLRYRAVMEDHLGRELRRDEHVHHINGDPTDDRIENLQVMAGSEHCRMHAVEHWSAGTGVACRTK